MTNAEKFKEVFGFEPNKYRCEVFGFEPNKYRCVAKECEACPLTSCKSSNWWNEEYRDRFYNGKVCCIFSDVACFTKGKIYEVINGVLLDDEKDENCSPFSSFDQLNNYYTGANFIEVIE